MRCSKRASGVASAQCNGSTAIKAPHWIVVLGASAGGVESLRELFRSLQPDLDAAFLVVLHIPAHSPSRLDEVLASATAMPVSAPHDKQKVERGHVYVATADRHLMVEGGMVRQTRGPKECRARPAIDVLFRSAAVAYGPRTIGVVLSGMLDDGTAGLWAIKDSGGIALVQDPQEAVHSPMPESAIRHVQVDSIGRCSEERVLLLRQMSKMESEQSRDKSEGLNRLAHDAENSIKALKELVLDVRLFGRQG